MLTPGVNRVFVSSSLQLLLCDQSTFPLRNIDNLIWGLWHQPCGNICLLRSVCVCVCVCRGLLLRQSPLWMCVQGQAVVSRTAASLQLGVSLLTLQISNCLHRVTYVTVCVCVCMCVHVCMFVCVCVCVCVWRRSLQTSLWRTRAQTKQFSPLQG